VRIYATGREPGLANGVVSLLLAAIDAEQGEVCLVSPWLRDVELPVAGQGHFASVFAGHRDTVWLSELLGLVASRHRLTIITRTPGELVPLAQLRTLHEVLRTRVAIAAEEAIRDYDAVEYAVAALTRQANALSDALLQHAPTLSMGSLLAQRGADVRFLERLHAKLLWTPAGSLLGSANFTAAGLARNEELMLEVTSLAEHQQLREVARDFARRASAAGRYSLSPALRRFRLTATELRAWTEGPMKQRTELHGLLRQLLAFIH
jgi:phosphatidylserine/phosphatidylglycerophosphate/cardiolipin synthase-like enzyme